MGTNAVFVHALGETGKFAAYDPSDMLEHLDRLREQKPRVVPSKNQGYQTWSVLLRDPERIPSAPFVITGGDHLPEAVRTAAEP
jgi:hypothetical protein